MIVICQNCETKFDIPDDKYQAGRKARCSSCGSVFPLPQLDVPIPSPEVSVQSVGTEAARTVNDDIDALLAGSGTDARPDILPSDVVSSDQVSAPSSENEAISIPPSLVAVDDVVSPIADPPPLEKRSRKKVFFILGIVFALALLCYGVVMVYSVFFAPVKSVDPVLASDTDVVSSLGGRTGGGDAAKETVRLAAVSRLTLDNVRQQTVVENDQTGPMVVIEGTVVNNFDTPRDLILLEITLYDSKGNALVMREQYCGITLSLLQLRTLSKAALESALSNQVNILTNNADIPSGGQVPFTTVFFNIPNAAYEFEVKIVDVQDPSQKK